MQGIPRRQREYKLLLFADDILLTLTNPLISLTSLHALLTSFGALSGYKVITNKTEALPIHIPPGLLTQLQQGFLYAGALNL